MEDKIQREKWLQSTKAGFQGEGLDGCKLLPRMEEESYIYRRMHPFVFNNKTKLHHYKSKSK
jgi:hypothetical protein